MTRTNNTTITAARTPSAAAVTAAAAAAPPAPPPKPKTHTIKIIPHVTINAITDIDFGNQSFQAELLYELKWEATRADYDKYKRKLMFPKLKPITSILDTYNLDIRYTLTTSNYTSEQIEFKCVKTSETEYWVLHSFLVRAVFFAEFAENMYKFPFDSHQLSMQLSVNKVPSTWDDKRPMERFEFDSATDGVSLKGNNQKRIQMSDWIVSNPQISFKSSHKTLDERAELFLNGFSPKSPAPFPSDLIRELNKSLGRNNGEWISEPKQERSLMCINAEIRRRNIINSNVFTFFFAVLMCVCAAVYVSFAEFEGNNNNSICNLFLIVLMLGIALVQCMHVRVCPTANMFGTFLDKYSYASVAFILYLLLSLRARAPLNVWIVSLIFIVYHTLFTVYACHITVFA